MNDKSRIKQANQELLERMRDPNDRLQRYSAEASWWQPRPIIKKDFNDVKRVLGLVKPNNQSEEGSGGTA